MHSSISAEVNWRSTGDRSIGQVHVPSGGDGDQVRRVRSWAAVGVGWTVETLQVVPVIRKQGDGIGNDCAGNMSIAIGKWSVRVIVAKNVVRVLAGQGETAFASF